MQQPHEHQHQTYSNFPPRVREGLWNVDCQSPRAEAAPSPTEAMSWADCFETPPKPTQRRVCFPRLKPGSCEIDLEAGTVRAAGVECKDDDVVTVEEQDHW